MKKILYIANVRIPTEKAHGIQIMKMCEAFANAGNNVELIVPRRLNPIKQNPFEYYGVKENFKIKKLPTLDLVRFGRIGFWIQSISFAKFATVYSLFKKADFIYSRDELPLFFLSFFRKNIFWETHTARENFVAKKVAKKVAGIISITQGLKDFYVKNFGIEPKKILVASDGVDLENFSFEFSKGEFKKKENLSLNKKIIFYSGHLYDWKGAQILADASVYLNENNLVVFVGGTDEDIEFFKKRNNHLKNVIIIGHRKYSEMPSWQKSADVLVLPNTEKQDISKYHTSPMKLFEYMASGNPIVASNLPSIGEILNEKNSILVEPDNPKSLADGINKALNDVELGENLAKQALIDVQNYTWKKRVNNILNFIK